MKPEIALKIDYDRFKEYTREQIETIRDEWIAAYREIAESDSSKKELCDSLTDRISRAAELFIRRHIEPAKSDAISHDDSYYEWLDEMKQEENDSLEGDFPLGNEADMKLASSFFSIKKRFVIILYINFETETHMKPVNNPVIYSDFPDIDIVRAGDTYYMVTTTMYFMPGGDLLRSYDLIHWEFVTHIFDSLEDNDAHHLVNGANIYSQGMWAPSLRYHKGCFYLVFSANDSKKTYLFTATNPEGPWKKSNIQNFYHDSSLFFDDDVISADTVNNFIVERYAEVSGETVIIFECFAEIIIISISQSFGNALNLDVRIFQ